MCFFTFSFSSAGISLIPIVYNGLLTSIFCSDFSFTIVSGSSSKILFISPFDFVSTSLFLISSNNSFGSKSPAITIAMFDGL